MDAETLIFILITIKERCGENQAAYQEAVKRLKKILGMADQPSETPQQ